jgi:hypothetical protein
MDEGGKPKGESGEVKGVKAKIKSHEKGGIRSEKDEV